MITSNTWTVTDSYGDSLVVTIKEGEERPVVVETVHQSIAWRLALTTKTAAEWATALTSGDRFEHEGENGAPTLIASQDGDYERWDVSLRDEARHTDRLVFVPFSAVPDLCEVLLTAAKPVTVAMQVDPRRVEATRIAAELLGVPAATNVLGGRSLPAELNAVVGLAAFLLGELPLTAASVG